ncbi:putative N-acetyltransferase HLS1-like protein isoform X1 [Cinnamomum micranthum f. kanehirae]|uniref:Putative N-acetyltransferase HLS1-like protein isoform X1 n=1 Tax=Cinnamomum micranthum f. kanehirae TaxID=337451 RepID=A0A3S4PSI8_9MAGN|nr:putative N-acetyltransferase HLS1-like protein isoform X1 [Cinnamomum micranthum f. kanehirae]
MDLYIDNKILIREFNEERDMKVVEKLERNCEIGSRKGLSILTNMMGDPLCRIRLYPIRVMLVAELVGEGEIVGVVRGCMKWIGTGSGSTHVKMGCILGLRVSPKHRRTGIGLKLVKSIEGWAIRNGAHYIHLATEKNNVASINLFVLKCDYEILSSLAILVQPIDSHAKSPSQDVRIEKLSIDQAIALYKDRLAGKEFFPADIDTLLREKLSLGTWVSYFKDEEWGGNLHYKEKIEHFTRKTPSSWAMLSIWKTYEAYKLQIRGAQLFRCCYSTVSNVGAKVFPCFGVPSLGDIPNRPFGFVFLYGLHGEGEKQGELMKSLWWFACNLLRKVKDCKVIITELGMSDPLLGHIPQGTTSMSFIDDLWCLKKVNRSDEDEWAKMQPLAHLFVDPREF